MEILQNNMGQVYHYIKLNMEKFSILLYMIILPLLMEVLLIYISLVIYFAMIGTFITTELTKLEVELYFLIIIQKTLLCQVS